MDAELPNDPDAIATQTKQRDLLVILADGFEKIASALVKPSAPTNPAAHARQIEKAVDSTRRDFVKWWENNSLDVIDWSARIPFLTSGIAALNIAGANMTIATPALIALVGGKKVIKLIKSMKRK